MAFSTIVLVVLESVNDQIKKKIKENKFFWKCLRKKWRRTNAINNNGAKHYMHA